MCIRDSHWIVFGIFLAAFLIIGGDVIWKALRNIVRGRIFDENFLMLIATVGAFALQDYREGVAVMLFYQVGELFQSYAVNRSRKSISELMDIAPEFANVMRGGKLETVDPEEVEVGETIVVKPGEKIPLDGVVLEGTSFLDTSALTGESVPREVQPEKDVYKRQEFGCRYFQWFIWHSDCIYFRFYRRKNCDCDCTFCDADGANRYDTAKFSSCVYKTCCQSSI